MITITITIKLARLQEAYAEHRAVMIWALSETRNAAFNLRLPGNCLVGHGSFPKYGHPTIDPKIL